MCTPLPSLCPYPLLPPPSLPSPSFLPSLRLSTPKTATTTNPTPCPQILAEHIWLGANASNGTDLHNKTRVLLRRPQDASEVEWWTHETPEGEPGRSPLASLSFIIAL